ncbi:type II toxin-antitoxin system RelE/ParE family toxin [Ideonella azotifigens]|uniref:Type II toxin-antitoxin system RelE/ParE family toxin n=1 Tax=Ideonella azotifigens TaxID=513160 RepID=A0ABN1JH91_9BURK|nr:type II toxin-antitoxin system RelE/ParE family toxin [Ideonella azotifigens]MCD2344688.1 type II toxin-antitoxin system RelE/ParE family toxin [Ideonella azotifigens]
MVVFAPEASDQLEALFLYIAEHASPTTAQRYTDAVVSTCEGLAVFPQRGVSREDIRTGLRLTHHRGRTVIAYTVDDEARTVSIVGLFHGRQDHEGALTERWDD